MDLILGFFPMAAPGNGDLKHALGQWGQKYAKCYTLIRTIAPEISVLSSVARISHGRAALFGLEFSRGLTILGSGQSWPLGGKSRPNTLGLDAPKPSQRVD